MIYEWNQKKAVSNLKDHRVDFADAENFEWDAAYGWVDDRQKYDEIREIAVAPILGQLHVMVFTLRGDRIRIISLRRANKQEVANYEHTFNR